MRRSRPDESTTSTPSTIPDRMLSVRARSVASSSTFCPSCWIEWAAEASITLTRATKAEESNHVERPAATSAATEARRPASASASASAAAPNTPRKICARGPRRMSGFEQLVAELLHGDERSLEERQFFPQAPHAYVHCARFAWILVVPHGGY